jgi:hypothetical protein
MRRHAAGHGSRYPHISYGTRRERLLVRLDDAHKHWKFPRGRPAPGDSRKYRNWDVAEPLRERLAELDLQYPCPALDVGRRVVGSADE